MIKAKIFFQALACAVISAVLSLTIHIYVMRWVQPYIDLIRQGINEKYYYNPTPTYSWFVVGAAYLTAVAMIGVYVFLYYHLQHLIPGKATIIKILLVTLLLFGIKGGDLIRQPIMNFIVSYESMSFLTSLQFVILDHIDKWLANFFLAVCLVYICPTKL